MIGRLAIQRAHDILRMNQQITSKDNSFGNQFLSRMTLVEESELYSKPESQVLIRMTPVKSMGNLNGTLHGGALMTIIDLCTTVAIMSVDRKNRANVSAELSTSFLSGGSLTQDLLILSQVDRVGRNLAFTQASLYDSDLKLIATGKHTKAFLDQIYNFDGENVTYPKK